MRYQPRRKPRKPSTSFNHLPEEVVLNILHKLPTRTLLYCTCVCKYWNYLIKNPNFISTYSGNTLLASTANNNNIDKRGDYLLLIRQFKHGLIRYTLRFGTKKEEKKQISFSSGSSCKNRTDHIIEVIGLCNGLVCLSDRFCERVMLWNPSIQKSYTLPDVEEKLSPLRVDLFRFVGLGFDSKTNDFKVLKITQYEVILKKLQVHTRVELYSLNSDSWRSIDSTCLSDYKLDFSEFNRLSFASRSLHCVAARVTDTSVTLILGFDVCDEVFREIMLPESLRHVEPTCLDILGCEGESSIAVVYSQHDHSFDYIDLYELWVMRTYGVVESWTKQLICEDNWCDYKVLGFRKNWQVLLQMERYRMFDLNGEYVADNKVYSRGSLVSIDLKYRYYKSLKSWRNFGSSYISSYVESLALLDRGNNVRG